MFLNTYTAPPVLADLAGAAFDDWAGRLPRLDADQQRLVARAFGAVSQLFRAIAEGASDPFCTEGLWGAMVPLHSFSECDDGGLGALAAAVEDHLEERAEVLRLEAARDAAFGVAESTDRPADWQAAVDLQDRAREARSRLAE